MCRSETLSLVHEWKTTIEACLKKLSAEEQKKVEDFTLASLEAWLREDFMERKLPPEMTAGVLEQVRPFFELADKLDQKLQDALKLPGQPEQIRSELLDGGAYLVLRVSIEQTNLCETNSQAEWRDESTRS